MIDPNGVYGQFILAVAYMRQLQRVPLKEWSAAKAHQLDRATAEVDSQLEMLLKRSVMHDQFADIIDALNAGCN